MMPRRGQVWERDGHRIRLIDRRLDEATPVTLPAYIVVEREGCWHEDVDEAVQMSGFHKFASAGPLIGSLTLMSEWELVDD